LLLDSVWCILLLLVHNCITCDISKLTSVYYKMPCQLVESVQLIELG